jgi:MFS family permease
MLNTKYFKRNLILFIISYTLSNLISGILYDSYVNYLQEKNADIAMSFWAFYGYSTFIAALLLLLTHKIGYKKLLLLCTVSCAIAFYSVIFIEWKFVFAIATILALSGVQLHYVILAPYIATYTTSIESENINWYSRAYYMGYIGYFITTFLGGLLTVKFFSLRAGIDYSLAKNLTKNIPKLDASMYSSYIKGCEDVFLLTAIIATIAIIPIMLIKEEKEDYKIEKNREGKISDNIKAQLKLFFNKDAIVYIVYWMIISFAMGLFTSYYTVFLNRNLHIDRATSSLMVSLSYIAMVVFIFFAPYCVKKIGVVGTICFTVLGSIPFMILIANGDKFGKFMIPVVGISLFIRAGLANLGGPADSALSMSIITPNQRPAYNSLINTLSGIISIASGLFTGKFLFLKQSGYRYAYYIAGALYGVAALLLLFGLNKKYNKNNIDNEANNN